ncbi:WD40 repeat-like protein [Aulographum hederae CBS 113979]|uniref:WD40 repeat-like protein n=1 Tax=Aulographum hederae CBS 113979 TaxID=1176131 RepID=A0A6G1GS49_9PEZI|nr:WD40 repeat-like protein [Aulographum hederae CBS 113979]
MSLVSDAIWAASPTTTRGQPTPLSADPKGERIAYASNKSIFLRSIDSPAISKQYTDHTAQTSVARFSPSGYYVASGDVSGSVRVWDCVGEGMTKGEYHIIAGRINDLAWDGDSQRIIAVGDGKERFGHCITADSGNSVGEISGHSSQINCVSIRQQRPLRAATGSDDTSMVFYHGAPFKFNTSLRGQHNKFIFGTAFSPDGASLVTVGADRRISLYDGKTGEAKTQIGEGVHTGSIFGVSWAKDSTKFVTASADQTVRIWDAEAGKAVQTWRMGEEGVTSIPDQQMGCVWPIGRSDGMVISVDLEGNLNYLVEGTQKPTKVVRGHQKNVTAAAITGKTLVTGSYEGRVCAWDVATGEADKVDGDGFSNYVAGFTSSPDETADGRLYGVGWDDSLRSISASTKSFVGTSSVTGQPKAVAVASASGKPSVLVATPESIIIYTDGHKSGSLSTSGFNATAIAAHGSTVAVGGDDKSVRIYTLSSPSTLKPMDEAAPRKPTGAVSTLSFSPSGNYLGAGVANGKIMVYSTSDWKVVTDRWSAHTARVTSLAWDDAGENAVSGSLDTNVMVWSVNEPGRRIKANNAHKDGVNGVAWVEKDKVVSTGGDASVKVWKVEGL